MRRRSPHLIELAKKDRGELQALVHTGRTEQRVARRARILLAMENPESRVDELAAQVDMTPTGVWYVCRRYEQRGLVAVYDAPRSGRPREISPPGAGANRAVGVL